ncbi:3340_t:CDS:2, partial [Paraglomus occultum]
GIIQAASQLQLSVPLVVRLQGTNENEAKKLIAESDLRIITCDDLDYAAIKAVQLSQIVKLSREANVDVSFQLAE